MPKRMFRLTQKVGGNVVQSFWLSDSDADLVWLSNFKQNVFENWTLTVEEFHLESITDYKK